MKFVVFIIIAIFNFKSFASDLSELAGIYQVSCDSEPAKKCDVKINVESDDKKLEILALDNICSFNIKFNDINLPKKVVKRNTEIYGCVKETIETKFDGKSLTWSRDLKKCIFGISVESYRRTLSIENQAHLKLSATRMSDCYLKKVE